MLKKSMIKKKRRRQIILVNDQVRSTDGSRKKVEISLNASIDSLCMVYQSNKAYKINCVVFN